MDGGESGVFRQKSVRERVLSNGARFRYLFFGFCA